MTRRQCIDRCNAYLALYGDSPEADRLSGAAFADTGIPLNMELGVYVLAAIFGQLDPVFGWVKCDA